MSETKPGRVGTFTGRKHTEATKALLRAAAEARFAANIAKYGTPMSPETRGKMSRAATAKPWTDAEVAAHRAYKAGRAQRVKEGGQ